MASFLQFIISLHAEMFSLFVESMTNPSLYVSAYICVIAISFIIGASKGLSAFFDWLRTAGQINCPIKSVEPIINISRDVGALAWYVMSSGAMSAFVGGTAPISVPILMYCSTTTPVRRR